MTARNFDNNWLYVKFSEAINLCQNIWLIENWKCQLFCFWNKRRQKEQNFQFFKGCFSVMCGSMDMIFGLFWETYVRLLIRITSQFLSRCSKSYNNLNVKICSKLNFLNKKTGCVGAPNLYVTNTTLQVLSRMVLINFVAFVVFKMVNRVSMQNLLNANNWHMQNLGRLSNVTSYLFSMYFKDQLLVLSNFWFPRLQKMLLVPHKMVFLENEVA